MLTDLSTFLVETSETCQVKACISASIPMLLRSVTLMPSLFYCSRYHHFKVKAPSGTPFTTQEELNEYDPFALACFIPAEVELIPERPLRNIEMYSKSQQKRYTLLDVRGSQIGRVQYFLNKELSNLLRCAKVSRIRG